MRDATIPVCINGIPGASGELGISKRLVGRRLAVPGVCGPGSWCRCRQWPAGLRYILRVLSFSTSHILSAAAIVAIPVEADGADGSFFQGW